AELALAAAAYFESTGRPAKGESCLSAALERSPESRPLAERLALALSARAGDDNALWERAWALLGSDDGPKASPGERFGRGVVVPRCADAARREDGVARLEALVADLPAGHPAASTARDYLARYLLNHNEPARAIRVAAAAAGREGDSDSIAFYARALIEG